VSRAARAEVQKLLEASFIRQCQYPKWISNVACPKDSYPLLKICKLMEATEGHAMLSFMDVFLRYHRIPLCYEDQEKPAFATDRGSHYYKVMPFGLKNAEATHQQLVNEVFESIIRKTMEVYVDDMIVKSYKTRSTIGTCGGRSKFFEGMT